LEARVIVTSYNQHVRLLSLGPWLVSTTKVYSGVGADIVMESLHSKLLGERYGCLCQLSAGILKKYPTHVHGMQMNGVCG
jgi:hypothetical protein